MTAVYALRRLQQSRALQIRDLLERWIRYYEKCDIRDQSPGRGGYRSAWSDDTCPKSLVEKIMYLRNQP